MQTSLTIPLCIAVILFAGCDKETHSKVQTPGTAASAKKRVLEACAIALQNKPPIEAINAYLDGFHFYSGHQNIQMEANHYCAILNEEVIQCVRYDAI